MTIGIIIQARQTSKRFPGKSMSLLCGSPVLAHVIERCKKVPFVDKVIVAMPAAKESEPMGELCEQMGVKAFYGPEDDVLKRYFLAATYYDLTTIVRITGDCPFIDPIVCGEVIALLKAKELDYCCNCHPVRTYPKGLDCETFTYDCLEAAHVKVPELWPPEKGTPMMKHRRIATYDREHVTPWMQRTKGIRRACVQQKVDMSHLNWCVDTKDDLERLEQELCRLRKGNQNIQGLSTMTVSGHA